MTAPIIKDTFIYSSVSVAKYLIALANERKISINITKVQKLLYITYGLYLIVNTERLVNEHPQAWPYGPVFPHTREVLVDQDLFSISKNDIPAEDLEQMTEDKKLNFAINAVLDKFGEWNAGQLTEWSHSAGSPWDKTRKIAGFKWGAVISDLSIYNYFKSIVKMKSDN